MAFGILQSLVLLVLSVRANQESICLDGVGFFLQLDFERKNPQTYVGATNMSTSKPEKSENRISSFQLDGMIVALVKTRYTHVRR